MRVILKKTCVLFFCLFLCISKVYIVEAQQTNGIDTKVYNEEDGSEWTEVKIQNRGVKITSLDGAPILRVDQFGGIYLDGDVYFNNVKFNLKSEQDDINTSWIYLLVSLSIVLSFYNFAIIKKKNNK